MTFQISHLVYRIFYAKFPALIDSQLLANCLRIDQSGPQVHLIFAPDQPWKSLPGVCRHLIAELKRLVRMETLAPDLPELSLIDDVSAQHELERLEKAAARQGAGR